VPANSDKKWGGKLVSIPPPRESHSLHWSISGGSLSRLGATVPITDEWSELKEKVTERFWLNLKTILEAEGTL
jgi:hypothetical protein